MEKRRMRVYYNSSSDTWSDDAKEQLSLVPDAADCGLVPGQDAPDVSDSHAEGMQEMQMEISVSVREPDDVPEKDDMCGFMEYAYKNAVYRCHRKQNKMAQNKWIQKLVSRGLGRHVSLSGGISSGIGFPGISNSDELYSDAITVSGYAEDVISDYRKPLERAVRKLPSIDTDGDGVGDSFDMTPGMRAMMKYM